jgi:type II secretory ATPase GspE/PulE/Tfp pilus assembly ATPase PilB-like protein
VFTRLLDMGVEPFLIASSITGVLAQRLVRRVCPHCAAPHEPSALLCRQFGLDPTAQAFVRGTGCAECHGIGYRGRLAIGELLSVSDPVAERILARSQTREIAAEATAAGMTTLLEAGRNAVRAGHTTVEELARLIPPSEA